MSFIAALSPARLAATRSVISASGPHDLGYTASAPVKASSMSCTTRSEPPDSVAPCAAQAIGSGSRS